jgi:CRISPR-associated endonuclease/helicase Cas3
MQLKKGQKPIYANTKQQRLDQHSFAVGMLAKIIFEKFIDSNKYTELVKAVYIAGCLHDIGKLDAVFQRWLIQLITNKKSVTSEELEDGTHIYTKNFKVLY